MLTEKERVMFLVSRRQLVRVLGAQITSSVMDAMLYNTKFDEWRVILANVIRNVSVSLSRFSLFIF